MLYLKADRSNPGNRAYWDYINAVRVECLFSPNPFLRRLARRGTVEGVDSINDNEPPKEEKQMSLTVGQLRTRLNQYDNDALVKVRDADPLRPVDVERTESIREWDYREDSEEYCKYCGHEIDLEPEKVEILVLVGSHE